MRDGVTPERFREVAGQFATGVTVVTTRLEGQVHGTTVNAFASLSLDPLLVMVCLDRGSALQELLTRAGAFAVTVLSDQQRELSLHFASPERPSGHDQFEGVPWQPAPVSGAPVLDGAAAWFDCRLAAAYPGGDHTIDVGEVGALGQAHDRAPLLFHGGRYHRLGPLL